jgi:hypothetical protein
LLEDVADFRLKHLSKPGVAALLLGKKVAEGRMSAFCRRDLEKSALAGSVK